MSRDVKLKDFAKHWLNDKLPADLIADLCDIAEDEDYDIGKRVHQIVWQAMKYGLENFSADGCKEPARETSVETYGHMVMEIADDGMPIRSRVCKTQIEAERIAETWQK
jgi:hypothetical protein